MTASLEAIRAAGKAPFSERLERLLVPLTVAVVVFWLAYDGGTFSVAAFTSSSIVIWWAGVVLAITGVAHVRAITGPAAVALAAFVGLAGLTLASTAWSSPSPVVPEFDRTALYVGVLALTVTLSRRKTLEAWISGIGLAVSGIAAVAMASRLFQGVFPTRGLPTFLPASVARLSFPLDYWNGLGIFLALGLPLLLWISVDRRRAILERLVAASSIPVLGAAIYLTSSRGAVASALIASIVLLALSRSRIVLVALLASGFGCVLAILMLSARHELVDGPITSAAAAAEGRSAALWLGLICAASAVLSVTLQRVVHHWTAPSHRAAQAAWMAVVVVGAAVFLVSHPVHRVAAFTAPPAPEKIQKGNFVRAHLLSGNSSGRWQFWIAAANEFRSAPILGRGAGSYESWWAQHASFSYFVRDAHSLYLETLGELGALGLLLLSVVLACGVTCAVRRSASDDADHRTAVAALAGAFAGYLLSAAIDWVWELPAVTIIASMCLGLLCGPATYSGPSERRRRLGPVSRRAIAAIGALLVVVVLCAEASLMLGDSKVRLSERAVVTGDLPSAIGFARSATKVAPWWADGYLQLALIREQQSRPRAGLVPLRKAVARSPRDWRLWLVRSRLEIESGAVAAARRSVNRARLLNPISPLFREGQ